MNKKEKRGQDIRAFIMNEIKNYFILHGYAPSLKEIGDSVGLTSTTTVAYHIEKLIKDGKLETDAKDGASRAIRVTGMKVIFSHKQENSLDKY